MRAEKNIKKRKKRKTWIKRILLTLLLLLAFLFGTGVGFYGSQIALFLDDIAEGTPEDLQDTSEQEQDLADLRPFSVLILGLDEAENENGRADALMVATVNPDENSVKLVSIPRDTVTTSLNGQVEKFGHFHAIGGVSQTIEEVEEFLEIPISFYASLNFEGLVDLVDAVGGIDVDSDREFTVQDMDENMDAIEIEEGSQQLDGQHALGYARMRREDPQGDWGRQERQREVIQSLADELISLNTLGNFNAILDAIRPNLETNMGGQQMWTIASNYTEAAENIETLTLDGQADYMFFPQYGEELYAWLTYEEERLEVQNELQEHLEIEETYSDEEDLLDEEFEEEDLEEESDEDFEEDLNEDSEDNSFEEEFEDDNTEETFEEDLNDQFDNSPEEDLNENTNEGFEDNQFTE